MSENTEKPPMGHTEASFHIATAGVRAAREAAAEGNDPAHVEALAETAAGGKVIGGIPFHRPSIRSAFAVQGMAKLFDADNVSVTHNSGLFLLCFADAAYAHRHACVGKAQQDKEALLTAAEELMLALDSPENIEAATEFCQEAFARLHGVKKPSAMTTMTSPPPPTVPAAAAPATPPQATAPAASDGSAQ